MPIGIWTDKKLLLGVPPVTQGSGPREARGLCAYASYNLRWVRIISVISACSMNGMIRIVPPMREPPSGSASYTCLMSRAHLRFAAVIGISVSSPVLHSAFAPAPSSVCPGRRPPPWRPP